LLFQKNQIYSYITVAFAFAPVIASVKPIENGIPLKSTGNGTAFAPIVPEDQMIVPAFVMLSYNVITALLLTPESFASRY